VLLPIPQTFREAEAERVAYVVMRALGEKPRSANYLAFVGVHPQQLLASLKRISEGAQKILKAIHHQGRTRRSRKRRA
jgi:hypothetical protein